MRVWKVQQCKKPAELSLGQTEKNLSCLCIWVQASHCSCGSIIKKRKPAFSLPWPLCYRSRLPSKRALQLRQTVKSDWQRAVLAQWEPKCRHKRHNKIKSGLNREGKKCWINGLYLAEMTVRPKRSFGFGPASTWPFSALLCGLLLNTKLDPVATGLRVFINVPYAYSFLPQDKESSHS